MGFYFENEIRKQEAGPCCFEIYNENGDCVRAVDSYIDASMDVIEFGGYVKDVSDGRIVYAIPEYEPRDHVKVTCGGRDEYFLVENENRVEDYTEDEYNQMLIDYFRAKGTPAPKVFFKIGDILAIPGLYGEDVKGRVLRRRTYESGIEELDYEEVHFDEDRGLYVKDGTKTARIITEDDSEKLFAWEYKGHKGYIFANEAKK